ncbi:MAG: uracil-DNA glycosylase [Stellaceae bacterium]
MSTAAEGPDRDCRLCPRLVALRTAQRREHADWHNAPVLSFGALSASLLIVGLAPGLRGANRTGRPFTGDFAGDLLYATLGKYGFARGAYAAAGDDGLSLVDCRITNAVRCVPPENKPTPAEIAACRGFLAAEIAAMKNLQAILALGRIAHDAALAALAKKKSLFVFRHGAVHQIADGLILADSYHCSRYNTNTAKLTARMFESVFEELRRLTAA